MTDISILISLIYLTYKVIEPLSVNLKALLIKFTMICFTLLGSETIYGLNLSDLSYTKSSLRLLLLAINWNISKHS